MTEKQSKIRHLTQSAQPLIHCITNPISIHDCANIILAAGGRPIMAEHPAEVAEITSHAQALALNLGNITDARMESMPKSLETAARLHIPVMLDLVGICTETDEHSHATAPERQHVRTPCHVRADRPRNRH